MMFEPKVVKTFRTFERGSDELNERYRSWAARWQHALNRLEGTLAELDGLNAERAGREEQLKELLAAHNMKEFPRRQDDPAAAAAHAAHFTPLTAAAGRWPLLAGIPRVLVEKSRELVRERADWARRIPQEEAHRTFEREVAVEGGPELRVRTPFGVYLGVSHVPPIAEGLRKAAYANGAGFAWTDGAQ
jgi:hypothetical protein